MSTLYERLWGRVDVREENECWNWLGATTGKGYGTIARGGRGEGMVGAHRVAFAYANGTVDGLHVRHTCDNPRCCNPRHLVAGTHADNMRDMAERERGWRTLLTATQVIEIRRRAADGDPQRTLATEFNVRQTTISAAVRRETWRHIP